MSTKVDICNAALNLIGAEPIQSFQDRTANARRCSAIYDQSRVAVLRLHPFNCAIKRIQLAPLSTAPAFEYSYQFQLPADLIRVVNTNTEDYVLETTKLLSNCNTLQLVYVFDNKNEETYDSLLVESLTLYMAYKLVKPITGSQGASDSYFQEFQSFIAKAQSTQGQETPSQVFGSDQDFSLITARYVQS